MWSGATLKCGRWHIICLYILTHFKGCQTGSGAVFLAAESEEAMFRHLLRSCWLPIIASPGNTICDQLLRSSGLRGQRSSFNLVPAYSIYGIHNAIEEPEPVPRQPIPTDVPVKEPIDVPVREPRDVPPAPQPERPNSTPTTEPHDRPIDRRRML